jgi:hypothetical protein
MKNIHKVFLFVGVCILLCGAHPGRYTPFAASGLPENAKKGVLCFVDDQGKIIRMDIHGLKLRGVIETIAVINNIKVIVDECPDQFVFVGIKNDDPLSALRGLLKDFDLVLSEESGGIYHVRKAATDGGPETPAPR